MRKLFNFSMLSASALLLIGCASAGDLRSGAPAFDQTVEGQPQKLAGCIGDQLENWKGAGAALNISSRPAEGGYSIAANQVVGGFSGSNTDTVVLVDIRDAGAGRSRVQIYTHFLMGGDKAVAVVRKCL